MKKCQYKCTKKVGPNQITSNHTAFHGFGQAKFAYGCSILRSSQFTLLPQLPLKTMLYLSGQN